MRRVHFVHAASAQVICLASVADSFLTRLIGLQGQRELAPGTGMWIVPTRAIHTFGMRFTIDAVALDRDLRVLGVCADLKPWCAGVFRATPHSVLELEAGQIRVMGIKTGDILRLNP